MAQTILAVLAILAGAGCLTLTFIFFLGNAMGGATNPSMVDHKPTVICAVLAVAGIAGGIFMLVN